METESQEVKETSSPNKSGMQKVREIHSRRELPAEMRSNLCRNGQQLVFNVEPFQGPFDAEDASDGPDSGAEEEAGEISRTRGEGWCAGGHHHRYGDVTSAAGDVCFMLQSGWEPTSESVHLPLPQI